MKTKPLCLICLLLIFCVSLPAFAERSLKRKKTDTNSEKRFALVIGNGDYKDSPLKNPVNDAGDMAHALKATGFAVKLLKNASQREMKKAIRSFGKELRGGGVGLFYFAGHGIQYQGVNYLIPTRANIESEADVEYEAVDAGRILAQMEEAGNKVNIVILDACRNNPFARSFRSAGSGLARMDAPTGSIIAYATAPGSVAADGRGRNGVYTKYLLQHLSNPGVPIERVFKKVRQSVLQETGRKQTPWESSSLTGEFYFRGTESSGQGNNSGSTEIVFWQSVAESKDKDQIKSYLEKYPDGIFASVARDKLKQLDRIVPVSSVAGNSNGKQAMEAAYWQSVSGSGELDLIQSYIDKYPNGGFVDLAARKVEKHLNSLNDLSLLESYLAKSQGRFENVASQRIEQLIERSNDWDLLQSYKTLSGGSFKAIASKRLASLSGTLTVTTTPADATVKILGIKPKYQDGIQLKPGDYEIEVSKSGYMSARYSIKLLAGGKKLVTYELWKEGDKNSAVKMFERGTQYLYGTDKVIKNQEQALRWFQRAASYDHAPAMVKLGWMYTYGQGVDEDKTQGLTWYRKAVEGLQMLAETGDTEAMTTLAFLYINGMGVDRVDEQQAESLYLKASAKGDLAAMTGLGSLYGYSLSVTHSDYYEIRDKGAIFVTRSKEKSMMWYQKAMQGYKNKSKQGDVIAINVVAMMYRFGQGISEDTDMIQAAIWYTKAAEYGDTFAMLQLGELYADNRAINKNRELAIHWLRKAAEDSGNTGVLARQKLQSLQ